MPVTCPVSVGELGLWVLMAANPRETWYSWKQYISRVTDIHGVILRIRLNGMNQTERYLGIPHGLVTQKQHPPSSMGK